MATTIHEPPQIESFEPRITDSGNGGWRNLRPADGDLRVVQDYSPPPASTAIWVGLFAITMMFAAFTSALIVRQGASMDWQHLSLPSVLYLNTVLLLLSSVTLELARKPIARYMGGLRSEQKRPAKWLYITLFLGLMFVAGQYVAWRQLIAKGLYIWTNPNSGFFYVLTAAHAVHILGGLGGLVRVIAKLNMGILKRSTLVATARYWHFMDVLWIYLLILLWVKL
jgi:cytochrome c oxidase subunit 3